MVKKKKRNTIKKVTKLENGIIILKMVKKKVLFLTRMIIKMGNLSIIVLKAIKKSVKKAGRKMQNMVYGYGGVKMEKKDKKETIRLARSMGFGLVITIEGERSRRVNGEMVSSMENLSSGIKMEINLF